LGQFFKLTQYPNVTSCGDAAHILCCRQAARIEAEEELNMPYKTFSLKHIHKATYEIWLASYWQV